MKDRTLLIMIAILAVMSISMVLIVANNRANTIIRLLDEAEVVRVDSIERHGEQYVLTYGCDNGMKGELVFDCLTDALRFTGEVTE